jgi:membrane-bound lytic murein transglycosylase B
VAPPSTDPNVASISPALGGVRVDGPEYRLVKRSFDETSTALEHVHALRIGAEEQLATLQLTDTQLTKQVGVETARKKEVQVELSGLRTSLRSLAVAGYIQGALPEPEDIGDATAVLAQRAEIAAINASQRDRVANAERNLDDVLRQLNEHVVQRAVVRNDIAATQAAQASSAADEVRLAGELAAQQIDLAQARARATVVGTDFSLLAMDAYWRAAQETKATKPRCGIEWWAIAGISRTEGHHGTFGGAKLLGNGDTSPRILGIPLDGTNDTAVIRDTDNGAFDGNTEYDHAVGPMQFIPSTWQKWRADGNGDGLADPNNMYDATEAAAHYLCASGPMLTDDDLLRGYYSYNHSDDYANAVLGNAVLYRMLVIPPPPPDAPVVSPLATTTPVASGG